jgi:hypothetical protein
MPLTAIQQAFWKANGFIHLEGHLAPEVTDALRRWVAELEAWPETPGKWMKWFEDTAAHTRQLCRIEDFLPYHAGLSEFLQTGLIADVLEHLLGEPAALFKEKINYKLPGGSGFAAHQDAPAFASFGQHYHITMLVSVDASTVDNGCLEMVHGHHDRTLLPQNATSEIDPDVAARLSWTPLPTRPGDLVFFDSYVPHRSQPNRSTSPRRALYVTYNPRSGGSFRDAYFERKRAAFPPECERRPGVDYSGAAAVYNVGNPIR